MARVSDAELDQLKRDISLIRLMESQGYKLKKQGKDNYVCHCPFHKDDTPSLMVSPSKNLYHCFGCNAAGSVVDWMMKIQGLSFRHAVEVLRKELAGVPVVKQNPNREVIKQNTTPVLPPLAAQQDYQVLLQQVVSFYHENLKQHPEALEYLKKRGLNSDELINHFQLGFSSRTLAYYLPKRNRREGLKVRDQLREMGILRENTGHEHFNGALVVPVINDGQVMEMYGRKILGNKLRKGTIQHLYLSGEHQGIFNKECLLTNTEIILCESLIDAMTFWVNGFKNVTSSYGTNGFTDEYLKAFKYHGIQKVLIAYDRDKAGNTAAEELAEKLAKEDISCYRVLFPKNMDANEYALTVSPARKSLELVLRKAEWLAGAEPVSVAALQAEELDSRDASLVVVEEKNAPLITELPSKEKTDDDVIAEVNEHEIIIPLAARRYRVRGLDKNTSYEVLKINLMVSQKNLVHVDTFDLYNARQRQQFIKQAGVELGVKEEVLKKDMGKLLLKLELLQDQSIKKTLEKKDKTVSLSPEETEAALGLLKDEKLIDRIVNDFRQCGIVGEDTNVLTGYLAAVSRKLERPLAVLIQSSSAAGKSSVMDAVLGFMPAEERTQYSAMTGQSLYYMGEENLKNKILAIAEEEGAEQASYALKLLQSEGQITIASTGKNATTGNLETQEYTVEGPVMLFLTTTAIDIDEELLNRCLVLTVNETRAQTEAIHQQQRKKHTLQGLMADQEKQAITARHQNAQRLIRSLLVANPYAEQLTFLSDKTRTRRDHMKYLTLINAIALLHQYQRDIKTVTHDGKELEYIEVTLSDIDIANRLAHDVLGKTLDELPPQTRKLLEIIYHWVQQQYKDENIQQADFRFSRKEVRQLSGWTDSQIKKHIKRLEEMEYVLIHRGKRGQSYEYELLYDGDVRHQQQHFMGLLDTTVLKNHYDEKKDPLDKKKDPLNKKKEPSSTPQVAPKEPLSSPRKKQKNTINTRVKPNNAKKPPKSALEGCSKKAPTVRLNSSSLVAH